ncbi:MAG: hypothetical protein SOX65_02575 [Porphyromonas sp.]|uniref:hypothetical protein n=1 Tax=Porphyromonas sp. TaxID=1924944 RepID=UPI002A8291F4|nr:hypothetical protein [Porphyromonas sp.]MDY4245347.1 hypothetical protein [Porphyromonas sp.]
MATNTVLQWQSHITDSTDRETILGNLDFLENFAGAITGDKSLNANFEALRNKIEDGTLKPTEWKTSTDFKTITKQLTNASSGKLATLTEQGKDIKEQLGKAKGDITSQAERLNQQAQTLSDQAEKLNQQAQTLSDQGTRITNAEGALGKKLDSKTFEDFKKGDFKVIKDKLPSLASSDELKNLKILLNKEVSHWTEESTPAPTIYTATAQVKASKQPWGQNEDPERHVGDLCTVIGEGQKDKGVSYRFVKNPSEDSYRWLKVIDNDGALALSKQAEFEKGYNKRQIAIDNALNTKQPKGNYQPAGNYVEKIDYDKNNTKVDQEINTLKNTYKVTVTTKGSIRNGAIVDGVTQNGTPAILHTAHVYNILGNKVTSLDSKLKWTINKNRTTEPKQRIVTGATCYVTTSDFVANGTNPQYYDIELNSDF